jgi:hypothetical protein
MERDILRDDHGGEHGTDRDDEHEVKNVQLGESAFARNAQHDEQRREPNDGKRDGTLDVVPTLEKKGVCPIIPDC